MEGDAPTPVASNDNTRERPYSHLINHQADTDLFNKTFPANDSNSDCSPSFISTHNRTGLIYNAECVDHYCLWDANYEENPRRFSRTLERMKELGLVEKCVQLKPRKANINEIKLVHSNEYIEKIASTAETIDPDLLEKESSKYDAVYFSPSTFEAAFYAAGSTIELVDRVVKQELRNGFALVRPPGHHAMQGEACGYCIFNNVAIAASYCLDKYKLERILIVDWDVHHGQATQRTFYDDPRVLYCSLHRYEMGAFWPELIESNYNFIGNNQGRGFNINVPLNDVGLTDSDYLSIWHNLLLPIFYEFNPQLVLVSAGYDAAIGCPEGEMLLTPAFYAHATHSLMALANGNVCVVLEGGYCVESLADSAAMTLKTLLGEQPIPLRMRYPLNPTIVDSVLDVISVHRPYWNVLRMQRTFDRHESDTVETHRKRHYPLLEYKGSVEFLPEKPEHYPTRNCYPVQSQDVKDKYADIILRLRVHADNIAANFTEKRTCLITMPDLSRRHIFPTAHPERPNRTIFLWKFLKSKNILSRCFIIKDNTRAASEEEIRTCHSEKSIEKVRYTKGKHYKDLREYEDQFDSVYFTADTFEVAKLAAGCLLQVIDCVMQNQCLNGFACIRPPGHHASKDQPAGFCFFNNISISAKYAIERYKLQRILIVDWDVHHGDGTQDIVINDERILFISLHRYDHASFYPEKLESNFSMAGNVINIPWNGGPMSDQEYLAAFFNLVLPVAYNFNPELVLISAGFDAAHGDPLGEYAISPQAYGHMTHMLSTLANGKLVMSLEGGYNLKSIADSALECISVLLGDPPKSLPLNNFELNECAIETIQNVIDYHADRWPCFAFNVDIPETKL